jgi:hypothetical protein
VNSGIDGLVIDWANADSTIIRLETTKITTRSNEKFLLAVPIVS